MAGSYKHVVTKSGKLRTPEKLLGMLETSSGDVYEAIEEMYGMIWDLAESVHFYESEAVDDPSSVKEIVEHARVHYKRGIQLSPGKQAEK